MRVAHVAAEVAPWCTSGGLGQVMGALPAAVAALDDLVVDAFYPLCRRAADELEPAEIADLGDGARLMGIDDTHGSSTYFVDAPAYFDRPSLYGDHGDPYPDEAERFAFFSRAVVKAWQVTGAPEIAHCHDWHAAPLLSYVQAIPGRPATVLTIHNLAYQGSFSIATDLGLPKQGDTVNFLKTGIQAADVVTTVSPRYASEILTDGAGLEEDLVARAPIVGILNGIDVDDWDPTNDGHIPEPFSAAHLEGKAAARTRLIEHFGLDAEPSDLVVSVISRLVEQKGIDLVVEAAPMLFDQGVRIVVIGNGDPVLEQALGDVADANPGNMGFHAGWDVALAHLATAGSDAVVIPSRFEPCGLTQMQAMRYGTVPVVHAVGGLADTVSDPGDAGLASGDGTGFSFSTPTPQALSDAVTRAANLHRRQPEAWRSLARSIMSIDWSWERAAHGYADLYRRLGG